AHGDAELLPQLARQSLGLRLIRGDLSPGKLPAPGHVLAGRTFCNEHAPGTIIERSCDDSNERLRRYCHRMLNACCALSALGDEIIPARQRAVAILVLLTGATGTGLVA